MIYQLSQSVVMYLVRRTCIALLNVLNIFSVTTKFLQQFESTLHTNNSR